MQITKEFLESEIAAINLERSKAQDFLVRTEAVIESYRALMEYMEKPEPVQPTTEDQQ